MYDIYDNDFDRAFDEAVDEIEKQEKQKKQEDEPTVYGYNLRELVLFAKACREQGITESDLHDFCLSFEAAYNVCIETIQRVNEKVLMSILNKLEGDTE